MAKTVNETQLKTRKTKLSKKSNEDLINIILRKDDVERKLNKQIVNLKTEVNDLNSKVKSLQLDIEDANILYKRTKEQKEQKEEEVNYFRKSLNNCAESAKKLHRSCVEKTKKLNDYKAVVMTTVIYSVIMTLLWVFG